MTVRINRSLCNGCGLGAEGRCVAVCPGGLLYKDNENKCHIRDSRDCWDCAACIKECRQQAIVMYLPAKLGGRGAALRAKIIKNRIIWLLTKANGEQEEFTTIIQNND